ncbi:MAG: hypothetical protein AB7T37_01205 [Dehalococcoidia bacterium]
MQLRLIAMALLAVPAGILLALGVGELVGGDISGVQHLPEAAILVGLMALAWWRSRTAGRVLVVAAPLLYLLWFVWMAFVRNDEGDESPLMWAATGAMLFLPPLVAGGLLLRSSRPDR